ncbi:ligninase H2 [Xylariomycetidae sp. FL2044]|nr:ligninase H2 [Xylariomycetidae sp. FL2044]
MLLLLPALVTPSLAISFLLITSANGIDYLNPADTNTLGGDAGDDSFELLGDLVTLGVDELTPVGRDVRELLLGGGDPESDIEYADVPALGTAACAADACCVWKHIADQMAEVFRGASGRCTRWARMAVRLGFHDAATWSKATAAANHSSSSSSPGGGGGGADGSICLTDEYLDAENDGLQDICVRMREWYAEWRDDRGYPITMADLIQMGANVAAVVCPLGPRVRSFVGRADDATNPGRSELLPSPLAPAEDLIRLFRDKTISPHALVALVGAHTTSQQHHVDAARDGDPQDSTPGVWDSRYYGETDGSRDAPSRVFRFPSDVALAQHPSTADEWSAFAGTGGQSHWNIDYAWAYIRLSLLGVNNINELTECTKALPRRVVEFANPDQVNLSVWLNGTMEPGDARVIADTVEIGDTVHGLL